MANATTHEVTQPTEPVRRSPTDSVWFTVLALSIAVGIGMTIFAPVGGPQPVAPSVAAPASVPTTEPLNTFTTQPATAPLP
jgi:hypothetical protein